MNNLDARDGASVKSAKRVLDLFEFFAERRTPAISAVIADGLNMPRSSCFALIGTLAESGYLYEVSSRAGYYPTQRWLQHARVISEFDPIVRTARPMMERLRDETGETVILARRSANRVLYVDVVESLYPLRYSAKPGQLRPLHSTASGRAILGTMTSAERRSWFARAKPKALTPKTVVDPDRLDAAIAESQSRGYYVTTGEHELDVSAISCNAPIGDEFYVLSIAGPTQRLDPQIAQLGRLLRATCAEWSR